MRHFSVFCQAILECCFVNQVQTLLHCFTKLTAQFRTRHVPRTSINTLKNSTQFKLSDLHNLSINTSYKKFLFTLYTFKKKITEASVLQRRYLYEEMICSEDIKLSICWVTLVTEMFSYNLPPR